jgi:flagellar motility protein MotE (MotC chaperone)
MMKKIQLFILIGAGILSFAVSFTVSRHLKKSRPVLPQEPAAAQTPGVQNASDTQSLLTPRALQAAPDDSMNLGLTEQQLQNLIQDIRDRMQEYRTKEKQLTQEAERIQLAHQSLQEEIDQLNQLRNKLTVLTQNLDTREQQLKTTLLQIETVEQANFQRLAATYDKMDTTQAGRILATMASGPQASDAIKILYYMSERTAAKVLGEIGATQPDLAAMISMKLKRVKESG